MESPQVRLIHVDDELFHKAWQYLIQHQDKRYSFADSISFVLMREFGIQIAFTFDHHFRQAGFITEP